MTTRNSCYTFFQIIGEFYPDEVSEILNLMPEKTYKIGDLRKDGTARDFALWAIGSCTEYDAEVGNQMRKTISQLKDKIWLLNQIRENNDVKFELEIVPSIYPGESTPCLAPPMDVIDFCHATRTEIDIDLYVYDAADEKEER